MKHIKIALLLLCCLFMTACAYARQSGMREDFEKQMKDFNRMLRWQEMEHAGMLYIAPESRAAFIKGVEAAGKKGITITDYRILTFECLPEQNKATAVALFEYYTLPSNRIKSITYNQDWVYNDTSNNNSKKGWILKSGLPQFE